MRVVKAMRFGDPDVLVATEEPDPLPGPGQVVVGVAVVDTLFLETQIRRGLGGEYFPVTPPYVPGGGVAGRVISVGDGVDPGWVGRAVVTRNNQSGAYAEWVLAPADALVPVPEGLGLPEAAALVHDGLTAMILLESAKIQPGEWVLITAAAGGMGILLVQLAHAAGAHVIAAARGMRKLDLAREHGADEAVDYTEPGWSDRVREVTVGVGVDVVLDGAGGQAGLDAFAVTRSGGRFSAHGTPSGAFTEIDPAEAKRRKVTMRGIQDVWVEPADMKRLTAQALAEAAAGRIKPVIGQTFPLERAADAHAAIEDRTAIAKTLLLV